MRIDGQELRRSGRSKRGIRVMVGVVAFVSGYWAFSIWTRDQQAAPPRMLGSLWTAQAGGTPRIYYVMEEERSRRGSFDTDGAYPYSLPYSVFTLHARNARDGAAPAVTEIARVDHGVANFLKYELTIHLIQKAEILGPQGGVLWLWNDGGVEARNLVSLQPVWTNANLKEINPELAALLPTDRKYYKVLGPLHALVFKGTDARYFQVDPASGKIQSLDEALLAGRSPEYHKSADNAFSSLQPGSKSLLRSTSVSGLMWENVIDDGDYFALLTSDQAAGMVEGFRRAANPQPGDFGYGWGYPDARRTQIKERDGANPSGEVWRSAYRATYKSEESRTTTETLLILDDARFTKVSEDRFLMGGFLRRPNAGNFWAVVESNDEPRAEQSPGPPGARAAAADTRANDPAARSTEADAVASALSPDGGTPASQATSLGNKSYLVLHRKALGEDSPWHVTRLGLDGTLHWTRSTGIADPNQLCDGGGTVVFTGYADHSAPADERPELFVFIDARTGQARTLNLVSNETTGG